MVFVAVAEDLKGKEVFVAAELPLVERSACDEEADFNVVGKRCRGACVCRKAHTLNTLGADGDLVGNRRSIEFLPYGI